MALIIETESFRSSRFLILFTICTAFFTDGIIYGIVAPVIPFVLKDQNFVPESKLQLSTSLLIAAFSIADFFGAPLCAYYVDHSRSRRGPWYLGIALITIGTLLFGFSTNLVMLIFSRILQGLSSSILYTVGLAVLVDTIGKDEVGQWMGTAMSCNNIGMIISPLLGGIVYDKAGKMAVFGIMLGLGAFDVVLRVLMKEPPRDMILSLSSTPADTLEKADPPPYQEVDETQPGSKASKTTVSTTFVEIPLDQPKAPSASTSRLPGIIALLRSPRLLAALYGVFINECIVTSLCAILPLYVNTLFHWTALPAGLLFLTIAIPALAGPLAGALSDRCGARWVAVAGFLLTTPSLVLLRLVDHDSLEQKVLLCALLTIAGSTIIFFLSPLGAECSFVAEQQSKIQSCDMYASSFSLMNCALASAGLLGPMAAGGLQDAFGWKGTTIAFGVLCASGAVPCALVTGKRMRQSEGDDGEA